MIENELPDLRGFDEIAIDVETHDPGLKLLGSGVRRNAKLLGIAYATADYEGYLSFGHDTGNEFSKRQVIEWAKVNLCRPEQDKIFANGIYDLDFLYQYGIEVKGNFYDIQNAEPLLNENRRSYSLDTLAKHYLGVGKDDSEMDQFVKANFGNRAKTIEQLKSIPGTLVKKYATKDARLTHDVFHYQKKKLLDDGLWGLFELESALVPLLLEMKRRGVLIDVDKAKELSKEIGAKLEELKFDIMVMAGFEVNVNASKSIAKAFDVLGYTYPFTEKGSPSFTKKWLDAQDNDLCNLIRQIRTFDKMKHAFIDSAIIKHSHRGKIHCQFNQLKGDEYGTVSGRFSSSNPNLQQIPSRAGETAKAVRALFIPRENHTWYKLDYSAIEPRLAIHFATDKRRNYAGAEEAAVKLRANPNLDVYQPMMDKLPNLTRSVIKMVYLGLGYSMGSEKLADALNVSKDEAIRIRNDFNNNVPYLKLLSQDFMMEASQYGQVETLLGRIRRFDGFCSNKQYGGTVVYTEREAVDLFGPTGFERAGTYRAFNNVIQGSSADIIKKAMVEIWQSGLCDVVGAPVLTVHDELDFSVPNTSEGEEAIHKVKEIMENCVELRIPLIVDMEKGPNWGEVK
jgi:DNA polymerase I-like protein with 3'-5' exonuclease and polymerase domains